LNQTKVFEFAKEVGIETLALMDKIREWKLPIKSHMATLDDQLMTEIRTRLEGEGATKEKPKKGGAKTATRKAAPKAAPKAAAPKTETAKVAAPPAARKKVVKKDTEENLTAKKTTGVIRRKAGEKAEAEAAELREAEELLNQEALAAQAASEQAGPSEMNGETVIHPQETVIAAGPATPGEAPRTTTSPVRRGNIIGRMDLKRFTPAPRGAPQSGGPGGGPQGMNARPGVGTPPPGGPQANRPLRNTSRNIRTGFYAAPSMEAVVPEFDSDKLKKRGAGPRETETKQFSATEFRKREVIFQPKKKKIMSGREARKTEITTPKAHKRIVEIFNTIKVSKLASEMGLKATELIKKLIANGVMATVNTDLDFDTVSLIVSEFGWEAQNLQRTEQEMVQNTAFGELTAAPIHRPPIVTVMGHVDHGKTSLLDAIRQTKVAAGEAGGITQHIGAYSVTVGDGKVVTFLDTPGHEAFTAMRARGANVTDIVIIVVAADDGVMPQTAEAINHAKAAGVPMIIAVNKIDRPNANPDRIKQQLTEFEIVPEEWGGSNIFVEVSALQKTGISNLLEQVLLQAEVLELKANPQRSATGVVVESRMERGRGPIATVLVLDGTLTVGQSMVAGTVVGRVRSMSNDRGEVVPTIGPGFPVEIMGLEEVPQAGDRFDVARDDEAARLLANDRKAKLAENPATSPSSKMSLEQIFAKVKAGDVRELAVVLKADVAGSLEAVKALLEKLGNEEVKLKIIHSGVGGITEGDVLLASTANGLVLGFNVRPDGAGQRLAKEKAVEVKTYSIIYEMQDDLKKALSGMLAPEFTEKVLGRAEVRNTFVVPKIGTIAGCFVSDGKVQRNAQARIVRDGKIVYTGKLSSLKRFKDDAREVAQGFECGIGIENFNDIKVGDVIEAFIQEQVTRVL
jgi:translation initiation factor IF-2